MASGASGGGMSVRDVFLLVGAAIGVSVGVSAWLVLDHANDPLHGGALSLHEFRIYEEQQKEWRQEIRDDIRDIKSTLYRKTRNDSRRTQNKDSLSIKRGPG